MYLTEKNILMESKLFKYFAILSLDGIIFQKIVNQVLMWLKNIQYTIDNGQWLPQVQFMDAISKKYLLLHPTFFLFVVQRAFVCQ